MRSKKGPSVFCRPTGGAAEQGGGHEGVVGNDGSGGSRAASREGAAWVAGRAGPHLRAFGRVVYGIQASSIGRCARPALPSVPLPLCCTQHTSLTRDAAPDLLHRQVADGVTGDNGQPGRVGCPPARPPVRSSDSTTSRELNDNDHAPEPGRDKDGERATARAGRVKQADRVERAKGPLESMCIEGSSRGRRGVVEGSSRGQEVPRAAP